MRNQVATLSLAKAKKDDDLRRAEEARTEEAAVAQTAIAALEATAAALRSELEDVR